MARKGFLSHQLLETEAELTAVWKEADELGLDVGEHADQIRWDKSLGLPADDWMKRVSAIRHRLDRAEGLLHAYNLHLNANRGE
jgi:hypothetical protein